MAIENTYLLGKNITLGCGFDLQAKAPLDSRQTVPAFEGLRALIIGDAAYEGMIVYDEGTKKTYQAQKCESYSVEVDGKTKTYDIAFREFGINESELKELIASETTAAMEFKGATATLPENPTKGDMWKVTASFEVAGETTKVGDSIVYNGEEWFRIPSGDDIEDTWRIVKVEGTSLGGIADGKELNLTAGDKLDVAIDAATGAVVYSHEEIAAPTIKKVGDDEGDEPTRTYIASIETDGYGHVTGYKTATENVEDTNTTYEFEGLPVGEDEGAPSSVYFQVKPSDEEAAEVIYLDAYNKNEADGKFVAKDAINTKDNAGLVAKGSEGIGPAGARGKVWGTDGEGNPGWKDPVTDGLIALAPQTTGDVTWASYETNELAASAYGQVYINHAEVAGTAKNDATLEDKTLDFGEKITVFEPLYDKYGHIKSTEKVEFTLPAAPVVNDGKFTVSGTGALEGTGEMTANQAGDTTATLDIKAKGVTTEKIADGAVTNDQIADNAVTKAKLAEDVQASLALADTALQEHQDISGKADKEHSHVAADITDFATEVAKVKVDDAAKADEATKATQDGNGKVIADTYAEKATTIAGYGITDAYTKDEVMAMFTWGTFGE